MPPPPAPQSLPQGYAAYPGAPAAAKPARGLGFQIGGAAGWSIGFGLASILVPVVTFVTSSVVTYFLVLPLFGVYRGFIAVRVGRTVGGAVGIVLNLIGAAISISLLAGRA